MPKKPRCTACKLSNVATLDAELEAGLSLRKLASTYGVTTTVLHRHHHAHVHERAASRSTLNAPVYLNDAQAPSSVSEGHSTAPVGHSRRVDDDGVGTSVEPADSPRVPRWFRRMQSRTSNVKTRDLARAAADAEKLNEWLSELGAPVRDIVPPGVLVSEPKPGLFSEVFSVPYDERTGYDT